MTDTETQGTSVADPDTTGTPSADFLGDTDDTGADDVQVEVPDYTGEPDETPTEGGAEEEADSVEGDETATEAAPADEPATNTTGDDAQAARYEAIGYPAGRETSKD